MEKNLWLGGESPAKPRKWKLVRWHIPDALNRLPEHAWPEGFFSSAAQIVDMVMATEENLRQIGWQPAGATSAVDQVMAEQMMTKSLLKQAVKKVEELTIDRDSWKKQSDNEVQQRQELREKFGGRPNEWFWDFVQRLFEEKVEAERQRDEARAAAAKGAQHKVDESYSAWLIEAKGRVYLTASKGKFGWTHSHDDALQFRTREQALAVVATVDKLMPELAVKGAVVSQHAWGDFVPHSPSRGEPTCGSCVFFGPDHRCTALQHLDESRSMDDEACLVYRKGGEQVHTHSLIFPPAIPCDVIRIIEAARELERWLRVNTLSDPISIEYTNSLCNAVVQWDSLPTVRWARGFAVVPFVGRTMVQCTYVEGDGKVPVMVCWNEPEKKSP